MDARKKIDGCGKWIWGGRHHVRSTRGQSYFRGPRRIESEGSPASLQNPAFGGRPIPAAQRPGFAPYAGYRLRRDYGYGITSQCANGSDETRVPGASETSEDRRTLVAVGLSKSSLGAAREPPVR